MSKENHMIVDHVQNIGKVGLGGGVTSVTSYVATEQAIQAVDTGMTLAQAQAIATLVAAVCTALYFFAAFVLTAIKIHKATRDGESKS